MERIFVNTHTFSNDWIMGKIAQDIQREATAMGLKCRCGDVEDYEGEEICYHFSYSMSVPFPAAKHNSLFFTHINYKLMEQHLCSIKNDFDSYICMSPEDVQFLIELGFDKEKVFGKVLPVRNTYIKPISIGIFSACYPDGRKNEEWILEYCKENPNAKLVNFVFIGPGWGKVVNKLSELSCSFEWHNVSRKMPYEYQFQQNKLASLNYYIYMGMDGGAMGTYDAYAQDVPLCVTFDGFHKAIPDLDYIFDNKQTFFKEFDKVVEKQFRRIDFFMNNTPSNYVKWLVDVWHGNVKTDLSDSDKKCISYDSVSQKKQSQYYKLNISQMKIVFAVKRHRAKLKKIVNNLFKH